jgi:hypothetical protein
MNDTAVAVAPERTLVIGAPPEELSRDVTSAAAIAASYTNAVTRQEMREALSEDLKYNKGLQATVEAWRQKIVGPMNEALRNTNAFFKKLSGPLELAERVMKTEALRWDSEQDRKRRAAEAEAARLADEERRRLAAKAVVAKEAGDVETAHALASAAAVVAPAPIAAAPKIAGEVTRETWHAEVDDLAALARAVADGLVPSANILPNMPVLNKQAVALKGALSIPGVRAASDRNLSSRAS